MTALALLFVSSLCLFCTGHFIAGGILAVAFAVLLDLAIDAAKSGFL